MAEYLRHHASGSDKDMILQRLRSLIDAAARRLGLNHAAVNGD